MDDQNKIITFDDLFAFGANPEHEKYLFTDIRVRGYAAALTGGYARRVIIFCPDNEFGPMRDKMVTYGANAANIIHRRTYKTTYYNGREMAEELRKPEYQGRRVCYSSSSYHNRANYFGHIRHDLRIHFVPAEAFIFAVMQDEGARIRLRDALTKKYALEYTRLAMDDLRGIGTDIAGQYRTPPQPIED